MKNFLRKTGMIFAMATVVFIAGLFAGCDKSVSDFYDTSLSLDASSPENAAVYREARQHMGPGDQILLASTRTGIYGESFVANSDGIKWYWYGYDMQISSTSLKLLILFGVIAYTIGKFLSSTYIGIQEGEFIWVIGVFSAIFSGWALLISPNGIVLSTTWLLFGLPFDVSCL